MVLSMECLRNGSVFFGVLAEKHGYWRMAAKESRMVREEKISGGRFIFLIAVVSARKWLL